MLHLQQQLLLVGIIKLPQLLMLYALHLQEHLAIFVTGTSHSSDAYCEQGGKVTISSSGQIVNLLIQMKNTNYNCLAVGGTIKFGNVVMYNLTTSSFAAWTSDDESFNAGILFWQVSGYKA